MQYRPHKTLEIHADPSLGDVFDEASQSVTRKTNELPPFELATHTRLPEGYFEQIAQLEPLDREIKYRENYTEMAKVIPCPDDYSAGCDFNRIVEYAAVTCHGTGLKDYQHPLYQLRKEAVEDRRNREINILRIAANWSEQKMTQEFLSGKIGIEDFLGVKPGMNF